MSVPPSNRSSRLHLTSVPPASIALQPLVNSQPQSRLPAANVLPFLLHRPKSYPLNNPPDTRYSILRNYAHHLGIFEEKYHELRRHLTYSPLSSPIVATYPKPAKLICRDLHPLLITRPATPASVNQATSAAVSLERRRGIKQQSRRITVGLSRPRVALDE